MNPTSCQKKSYTLNHDACLNGCALKREITVPKYNKTTQAFVCFNYGDFNYLVVRLEIQSNGVH